jgi:hypothetical protein
MRTRVLVTFCSSYGHVHALASAVRDGAAGVEGADVRLR